MKRLNTTEKQETPKKNKPIRKKQLKIIKIG